MLLVCCCYALVGYVFWVGFGLVLIYIVMLLGFCGGGFV